LFLIGDYLQAYERSGRISKFPAVQFGKGKDRGRMEWVGMKGVGSYSSFGLLVRTIDLHPVDNGSIF